MTSFSRSMTSLRVRIRTGRRLSGSRNVYQRISPRLTPHPPSPLRPKQVVPHPPKTRRAKVVWTGKRWRLRRAARQSIAANVRVPATSTTRPAEECHRPLESWPLIAFYQDHSAAPDPVMPVDSRRVFAVSDSSPTVLPKPGGRSRRSPLVQGFTDGCQ